MRNAHISCRMAQSCFTYRAAALIIKDEKLLVAKHLDHPCYYTVGGGVKMNETSEAAIIREILEETGAELEIDRLAYVQERFFELTGQQHHEIVFFYFMKDDMDMDIKDNSFTDQGTKETLHWLPISDLGGANLVPEFLKTKLLDIKMGIEHVVTKE